MAMYEEPKCYKCPDEKDHYHDHRPVPHYSQHPQHYAHTYPVPAPAPHMPAPPPLEWAREPGCPCEKGERGPQGYPGERGPQGEQGLRGPAGRDGLDGQPGQTGPEGPEGIKGSKGDQGEQGEKGCEGPKGCDGPQGIQGVQGEVGPQGDTGPQGSQGLQGIPGPRGDIGPQGDRGIQGLQGDQGIQGIQGIQGERGLSGFISCTEPDAAQCRTLTVRLEDGSTKDISVQGCVTNDACGCVGSCTTETPSSVTLIEETESVVRYALTYPSGYVGEYQINRLSGNVFSVPVADATGIHVLTDGETRNNFLIDTSGGPLAGGCPAPVQGKLDITNLTGGVNGTRIKKVIGGDTNGSTGLTDIGQNVFELDGSNDYAYDDQIEKVLVSGLGSTFLNEIQVLDGSTQEAHIWLELCFFEPAVYQTNAVGDPIPGSGRDSAGNVVPDSDLNDQTGNPVF